MIKILAEHVAELNISFGVLEESEGPSGAKMRGKETPTISSGTRVVNNKVSYLIVR